MQNIRKKSWPDPLLFLSILSVLLLISCNTRETGCLDPNAVNFDLSAEKSCDNCCTFPTINLVLSQKWNADNFNTSDTFYDVNQQPYLIKDLRYFLSSWLWYTHDGNFTKDTTFGECNGSLLGFTPDMFIVEPSRFTYTIDTLHTPPTLDSLQFYLGLVEDFSCLDETSATTPDVLKSTSSLFDPGAGVLKSIRIIVDKSPMDTLLDTIFIQTTHPYFIEYANQFKRGMNANIGLSVNYALWFDNVRREDSLSFVTSVLSGLDGSFYKTQ